MTTTPDTDTVETTESGGRKKLVAIIIAALVALAAIAAIIFVKGQHDLQVLREARESYSAASAELEEAAGDLAEAAEIAKAKVDSCLEAAGDEEVCAALEEALSEAEALHPPEAPEGDDPAVFDQAAKVATDRAGQAAAAATKVDQALADVQAAITAKELGQAKETLAASIASGEDKLDQWQAAIDGSENKVADNKVRTDSATSRAKLADAVETGRKVDADAPEAYISAASEIDRLVEEASWKDVDQAVQDFQAAEAAKAQAAERARQQAATKAPAKKAPAYKAPTKKKAPAYKAPAKKAPVKKAPAPKPPAKPKPPQPKKEWTPPPTPHKPCEEGKVMYRLNSKIVCKGGYWVDAGPAPTHP